LSKIASLSARRSIESLEGRRLLSVVLQNTILTLTGGGANDSFVLTKSGTNVSVVENGGTAKLFAISAVTRINASLGGGNDTINIGNSLTIPASVAGGDGADGIITGGGNDTIDGGMGNDYIEGRDEQDLVSYASRAAGVEAEINVDLQWGNGLPPIVGTSGAGGGTGENDTYYAVESIAGGSGDDTLRVLSDVWTDYDEMPSVPDLGIYGNDGVDFLDVSGVTYTHGEPLNIGRQLADGGAGDDQFGIYPGSWQDQVTLRGGSGEDYFVGIGEGQIPVVEGGADRDTFQIYGTLSRAYTIPNDIEKFSASAVSEDVVGNDLANEIIIGSVEGYSTIDGRGGSDRITVGNRGGTTPATILGGEGNDTIGSSADHQYIEAGQGDDLIEVDGFDRHTDQTVVGSSGNDTLTLSNYDTHSGWYAATVHLIQPETFTNLFIGDAAELIVEPSATAEGNVLRVKHLYMWTEPSDPPALLNLNDNPLIVSESGLGNEIDDPRNSLTSWLRMGRSGTSWGRGGIISSAVDKMPGTTLGVARAGEIFTSFPATFAGYSLSPTDIIVRYTREGDVNLDRKVDFADLVTLSQNYGGANRSYAQGNLDYSEGGGVDFSDLVILAQNYGTSMPLATVAASSTAKKSGKSVAVDVLR
jgi:hypothetical protein